MDCSFCSTQKRRKRLVKLLVEQETVQRLLQGLKIKANFEIQKSNQPEAVESLLESLLETASLSTPSLRLQITSCVIGGEIKEQSRGVLGPTLCVRMLEHGFVN